MEYSILMIIITIKYCFSGVFSDHVSVSTIVRNQHVKTLLRLKS